ncbi:hypothetical protein FRC02_007808 [Tulasnella sp. 418]|nr:hypothetical protein FRC02_007808 [Tulasnella sp. 418]
MPLTHLNDDIFIEIIGHLELRDICTLRRVSKTLNNITRLRAVWIKVITRDIIQPNISWPAWAARLHHVSDHELENLAIKTLRFQAFTCSNHPSRPHVTEVRRGAGSVVWMTMLRSRWILIASTDKTVTIWDSQRMSRHALVEWRATRGLVENGFVLHTDMSAVDRVVIGTQDDHTHVLEVTYPTKVDDSVPTITEIASLNGPRSLLAGQGTWLAFGSSPEEMTEPCIVDFLTGNTANLRRHPDSWKLRKCLSVYFDSVFILVARHQGIEVYATSELLALAHQKKLAISPLQHLLYPFSNTLRSVWNYQFLNCPNYDIVLLEGEELCATLLVFRALPSYIEKWCLLKRGVSEKDVDSRKNGLGIKLDWYPCELERIKVDRDGSRGFLSAFSSSESGYHHVWTQGRKDDYDEHTLCGSFYKFANKMPYTMPTVLWSLPRRDVPDLPRSMIFDPNSGIIVLFMASGALFMLDFTASGNDEPQVKNKELVPPAYWWGGLRCSDQISPRVDEIEPIFPYDDSFCADEWIIVYRMVEPEDPLPPPPGYPPGAPPILGIGLDPTVVESWPDIVKLELPPGWTNMWSDSTTHQWENLYYGHEASVWRDTHQINGTPIPFAEEVESGNIIIYVDGHFVQRTATDQMFEMPTWISFKTRSIDDILRYMRGEMELEVDGRWTLNVGGARHWDNHYIRYNWDRRRFKMCDILDGETHLVMVDYIGLNSSQ